AVSSPAIPTSGETTAPPANGRIPRNAEALPADSPRRCIPSEKEVVDTIPTLDTTRNNATSNSQNDKLRRTTTSNKQLPIIEVIAPANRSFDSLTLTAIFPVI